MNRMRRALICFALVAGVLHAEDFKEASATAAAAKWSAELSTGWDSLYMFRGVNQLPGFDDYGSGISWTALSLTMQFTENDSLTIGSWMAFGTSESSYKEIDGTAAYTHTFGALSVSLGYALYAVLDQTNGLYANELNVSAAYEFKLGPVTLSPGVAYAFNLGPAPGNRGYVEQSSSYLEVRADAGVPVWRDIVSVTPWAAVGVNFRYNTTTNDDEPAPFIGADHCELGIAIPVALREGVSLAPYAAASFQWSEFPGTRPATVWGGASVTVSF